MLYNETLLLVRLSLSPTTGNAYSASALFYLGLSLVGKVQGQLGLKLLVPLLLIGAKT